MGITVEQSNRASRSLYNGLFKRIYRPTFSGEKDYQRAGCMCLGPALHWKANTLKQIFTDVAVISFPSGVARADSLIALAVSRAIR